MKNIFNSYFWGDLKATISCFFFPRQRWLTKKIPTHWCDKVELIPLLLFECLVHYVEAEKGLRDNTDYTEDLKDGFVSQEYVDSVIVTDTELRRVYNYIKFTRPQLHKELDESYPKPKVDAFTKNVDGKSTMKSCEELYGLPFKEAYSETIRLEALIEEKDLWAMNTIIKHRQKMWT